MSLPHRDTPVGPVHDGPGRPARVVQDEPVPVADRDGGRWPAVLVPAVGLGFLVLTAVLDLRAPGSGPGIDLAPGWGWPYALIGLVYAACSGVVLAQDRRQGFGWALAVPAVFWGSDGLAQAYVRYGIRVDEAAPGIDAALWLLNRFGAFLPMTVAVLLLVFPTGRFLPGRWRRVSQAAIVGMALSGLVVVLAPTAGRANDIDLPPGVDLDAGSLALPDGFVDVAVPVVNVIMVLGVLVSMAVVVVRYRRSRGVERDRMRWLAWSVLTMAAAVLLSALSDLAAVRDASLFLLTTLPAVAMTVGIVRPSLVPVQDLLSGTAVFALLSAALVVVDLGVVAILDAALDDELAQRQVVLAVLLLTVLLYGPLRQRLSAVVRRLVHGERGRPYDVVAGLASTLEQAEEAPAQLALVADAVSSAFGVSYVGLEVDQGNGGRIVARHGTRPAEVRTLPIAYRGQEVGRVELPVRGLRSRLSRRDEQLLGDIARQAATAVRTSQLADELQDNRERLVVAREEERRRIRRDLHDGLGPALSGLVFQLESARLLVGRDPGAAERSVAATSAQLQEVVADVRRLVHDLRPPALDDLGLVGALRQQAERISGSGPVTTILAGDLGQLSAAVEVAAYRIAGEALTNVVRHASATTATVRLSTEDDRLVVEVADDGVGIAEEAEAGVGLVSLRERAAELGGRTEVSCPAGGGTVVRAWLPLGRVDRTEQREDQG